MHNALRRGVVAGNIATLDATALVRTATLGEEIMDMFLGTVQLFALAFTPQNWMLCDGTTLQINGNQALFALIGTTFGGDGVATFALPDLRGKEPLAGLHYCICTQGLFPSRP